MPGQHWRHVPSVRENGQVGKVARAEEQPAVWTTVAHAADLGQMALLGVSCCQAGQAHTGAGPGAGWTRPTQRRAYLGVPVVSGEPARGRRPGYRRGRRRLRQPGDELMTASRRSRTDMGETQAAELAVAFPDGIVGQALDQGIQRSIGGAVVMLARGAGVDGPIGSFLVRTY